MKMREQTKFSVLNYYADGWPFDFTLHLHNIQASIERHREQIEFADKYNLDLKDIGSELPDLISDLHFVKRILKGRFDLLVINETGREVDNDS